MKKRGERRGRGGKGGPNGVGLWRSDLETGEKEEKRGEGKGRPLLRSSWPWLSPMSPTPSSEVLRVRPSVPQKGGRQRKRERRKEEGGGGDELGVRQGPPIMALKRGGGGGKGEGGEKRRVRLLAYQPFHFFSPRAQGEEERRRVGRSPPCLPVQKEEKGRRREGKKGRKKAAVRTSLIRPAGLKTEGKEKGKRGKK